MQSDLTPYVPRLALEWLRDDPDATHRRIPGTLVFGDVSGFTALSERLARSGRIGAEQLSEVLDRTFAALLAEAAVHGGSMLKYGGDALLVLFWGDGHERRGAAAAVAMRAALRRTVAGATAAGRVRLRMSIGVESGDVDLFLVGDPGSHRELVVAGPVATTTTACESAAAAGQIVVGPTLAEQLPGRLLGAALGPGRLLAGGRGLAPPAGDPLRWAVPESVDAAPLVPAAIRAHVGAGGHEPEHRQAAVGFVQIDGVDDRLESGGPAEVAAALDAVVRAAQAAADADEVTFLGSDVTPGGAKLILVSGAPRAHPNAEERLLRAARSVVDTASPLPVRAGVARGPLFSGDVGARFRRTYTVLGDTVNTAARVAASAAAGQLRALPDVVDRSTIAYELEPQPPFVAKGKAEALRPVAVGAATGRRAVGGRRLPLVGRAAELAVLEEALRSAAGGAGRVVDVVGEAGIGKTRLLDELVARAEASGTNVVRVAADELERSSAHALARRLILAAVPSLAAAEREDGGGVIAAAVGAIAPGLAPWKSLIAGILGVPSVPTPEVEALSEAGRSRRTARAVAALVAAAAGRHALIVVEDAHWCDEASSAVLARLADEARAGPAVVVTSRRPASGPPPAEEPDDTVTLAPLGRGDAETLARSVAGRPLLPQEVGELVARSGGHPLFLAELADVAQTGAELPDTLEQLLASRIDALPPSGRGLLRRAAVLGRTFDLTLLEHVTGASAGDVAALGAFVGVAGSEAAFHHALVQQVAYEGLPFSERRRIHGLAATALAGAGLDAPGVAERVSHHAAIASMHHLCWEAARIAARAALSRGALAECSAAWRQAVQAGRALGVAPGELGEAWHELGKALFKLGRGDEAETAYERARRCARDAGRPVELARLHLLAADVHVRSGRTSRALARLTDAERILDASVAPDIDEVRALVLATRAHARLRQGRLAEATRAADEALAAAAAVQVPPAARATARTIHGTVAMARRDHDSAEPSLVAALEDLRAAGIVDAQGAVLNNLGALAYFRGDWDLAAERYAASEAAHRAAGTDAFSLAGLNLAEIRSAQGRLDEARGALDAAMETASAARSHVVPTIAVELARVEIRARRAPEARALLAQARAAFAARGATADVAAADALDALTAALTGDPAVALRSLDRSTPAPEASGPGVAALVARVRATAHVVAGSTEAAAAARAAVALADAAGDALESALARALLAAAAPDAAEAAKLEAAAGTALGRLGVVAPLDLPDGVWDRYASAGAAPVGAGSALTTLTSG